ncbi:asparagine synthase (glutamine-hydrolyzing) [Micromonospora sp. CPCC 205546]|uniref:asparagine synthase (glutamine-hydrolyzing) n=1 Tax=Micromonospora sp. CPCC 205546 TaxID=3122397 RepID=UPI002FEF8826
MGSTVDRCNPADVAAVNSMLASLTRRGPDGRGMAQDDAAILGFTRLALVAPKDGDQPFISADGQVVLMANGEVYNHRELEASIPDIRLRTKSDCEVLLHLYERKGLAFLDDVRGMFALVVHDRRSGRVIFARDRFGIKPIYHAVQDGRLVFASELKALGRSGCVPMRFDWEAALHKRLLTAEPSFDRSTLDSFVTGVHATPAATIEVFDLATATMTAHRYWELPDFAGTGPATDPDLDFVAEYRRLVATSVQECATADADVGLLLSGGLDSAAVAVLAARAGKAVTAFAAVTPGTLLNGDAEAAQRVAEHVGMDLRMVMLPPARHATPAEWLQLLAGTETPFCSAEQWYKNHLYVEARRTNPALKAMLLGQAADEFNGGYTAGFAGDGGWPAFQQALRQMAESTRLLRDGRLRTWGAGTGSYLRSVGRGTAEENYADFVRTKYEDIQQYNNWHEDRMAAMHGVEARVPFLDHRIVELTGAIPAARHAELLWDKAIARLAFRDVLPAGLAERPKISFYRGMGEELVRRQTVAMLGADGGALVERALSSAGGKEHLDPDSVLSALDRAAAGDRSVDIDILLRVVNMGLLDEIVAGGFSDYRLEPLDYPADEPTLATGDVGLARHTIFTELLGGPSVHVETASGIDFAVDEAGLTLVIVDGEIEYAVEPEQGWIVEALRRAVVPTGLGELIDSCGPAPREEVERQIDEMLGAGLLRTVAVAV